MDLASQQELGVVYQKFIFASKEKQKVIACIITSVARRVIFK